MKHLRWGFRWQLVAGYLAVACIGTGVVLQLGSSKQTTTGVTASPAQLRAWHRAGEFVQKNRVASEMARTAQMSRDPDCHHVACVALTFDDGPFAATTSQILSTLEAEQVPATFFVVGSRVAGNEALLQRMHRDGSEIGNHSWDHPNLTKLPATAVQRQIQLTQQAVASAGVPAPTLFRPPYGTMNQTVHDSSGALTVVLWNEDPKDWAAVTPSQVLSQVLTTNENNVQPGTVLIAHDIYHVTADSLQPLIQKLKQRNFVFVTVSQMMQDYPLIDGQFYGGYKPKQPI